MRRALLAAALVALPLAAQAQTAPAAATAPDPARLAAAESVVAKLVPAGIYQRMFKDLVGPMTEQMMGQMGEMPVAQLVRLSGLEPEAVAALGDVKLREIAEIYDPYWQERMRLGMAAMSESMGAFMGRFEPRMRAAFARAYASEFSLEELRTLDAFLATPVGAHYAAKSLEIGMSPEMMKAMSDMMPEMMEEMPAMAKKAQDATAHLPPPRTNKDLSPADRKRLGELFGVDPATLKDDAT